MIDSGCMKSAVNLTAAVESGVEMAFPNSGSCLCGCPLPSERSKFENSL
jgi:hypothetical protein